MCDSYLMVIDAFKIRLGCVCIVFVIRLWCICDTFVIRLWFAFDAFVIRLWAFVMRLVCICDAFGMRLFCVYDTFVMRLQFIQNACFQSCFSNYVHFPCSKAYRNIFQIFWALGPLGTEYLLGPFNPLTLWYLQTFLKWICGPTHLH